MNAELPKVSLYIEGTVRNEFYKSGQIDWPEIPHHEPRAPSGGVDEAAGLGGDELPAGGDAVDDVLGQAEAPEPQVD